MSSPFQGFDNATLYFEAAGGLVQDPDTGNWEPSTTTVQVRAVLNVDGGRQRTLFSQGVDTRQIALKGWLVNPATIPEGCAIPAKVRCDLQLPGQTEISQGEIDLEIIPDPWGVTPSTGQKVRGIFESTGVQIDPVS